MAQVMKSILNNGSENPGPHMKTAWNSPFYRTKAIKGADMWLDGKRVDDNTNCLWRIHDHLYDLTDYIKHHPGGQDWLKLTRGTDITEAFEAHHLSERPKRILEHFKVKQVTTPRSSPYTFHQDGFYNTLRRRVREELGVKDTACKFGPPLRTCIVADLLFILTIATGCLATSTSSFICMLLCGIMLALLTISGHNFFHQRDSIRMHYFDLSLMSSRDWRVSHALSHHLFPNTLMDLEVCLFEPLIEWLPNPKKTFLVRYISWIYSPFLWSLIFHLEKLKRILTCTLDQTDAIPLFLPFTFWAATGFEMQCLPNVIYTWSIIIVIASFTFGYIGLNAGHHHPEIFHAGDAPRKDCDWGLAQVDAILDRSEVCNGQPEFSLVTFGNHALHHLFPTIDNAHLPQIYPTLFQTCEEFGKRFIFGTFWMTTKGQFQQLARNKPNPNPPL